MANLLIIILALVSSFATASENQLAGLAHNDTTRWDFTSPGLPDHRSPRIFHDSFSARYVVGKECYRHDAPCIILENNYNFDVAIWGEIRQPLNSSGSPPQSSMAVNEDKWMILEPGWAALVKGSAEKYMGTVRGFPVCGERKYGVGFGNGVADGDCEGQFEETATRFEWTQLDPEQMGRANWRANMNISKSFPPFNLHLELTDVPQLMATTWVSPLFSMDIAIKNSLSTSRPPLSALYVLLRNSLAAASTLPVAPTAASQAWALTVRTLARRSSSRGRIRRSRGRMTMGSISRWRWIAL